LALSYWLWLLAISYWLWLLAVATIQQSNLRAAAFNKLKVAFNSPGFFTLFSCRNFAPAKRNHHPEQ